MRVGQLQWLSYMDAICNPARMAPKDRIITPTACVGNAYRERIEQLRSAVVAGDGLAIYQANIFSADRSGDPSDRSGAHPGWVTLDISYPQIDKPAGPDQEEWNRTMAGEAQVYGRNFHGWDSDIDLLYVVVGLATSAFVSVQFYHGDYEHGAAPWSTRNAFLHLADQGAPRDARRRHLLAVHRLAARSGETQRRGARLAGHIRQSIGGRDGAGSLAFDGRRRKISFSAYEIGGYAEGSLSS